MTDRPVPAACDCRHQREQVWGYSAHFWHRDVWLHGGSAATPADALALVATRETVLIRCRGCGKELLREYPK